MNHALRLAAALLMLASSGALADVKTGVDAWERSDYPAAIAAWRPLADAGDADAQYNLAQAYRLGRGVPADDAVAERWYGQAARQGHVEARTAYGLILFRNGKRKDAVPFLEEAAANNDPRAQYLLATTLFNGDLIGRDWPRAYALMTRAARSGLAAASTSLATMDRYLTPEQRQMAMRAAGSAAPPVRAAAMPRSGNWRVQLAAVSAQADTPALFRLLQERIPALAPYRLFTAPAGNMVRVQAGPLPDRAAAVRLCAAARTRGQPCFPVLAQ